MCRQTMQEAVEFSWIPEQSDKSEWFFLSGLQDQTAESTVDNDSQPKQQGTDLIPAKSAVNHPGQRQFAAQTFSWPGQQS